MGSRKELSQGDPCPLLLECPHILAAPSSLLIPGQTFVLPPLAPLVPPP